LERTIVVSGILKRHTKPVQMLRNLVCTPSDMYHVYKQRVWTYLCSIYDFNKKSKHGSAGEYLRI